MGRLACQKSGASGVRSEVYGIRKELRMSWCVMIRRVVMGLVVVAAAGLGGPAWAESGCHDRGNEGPVVIAGR